MDKFLQIKESLKNYNMLNALGPKHSMRKYPYNPWSDAKVEFTLENIELESDGNGVFFIPHDKKTGGGGNSKKESKIWIF